MPWVFSFARSSRMNNVSSKHHWPCWTHTPHYFLRAGYPALFSTLLCQFRSVPRNARIFRLTFFRCPVFYPLLEHFSQSTLNPNEKNTIGIGQRWHTDQHRQHYRRSPQDSQMCCSSRQQRRENPLLARQRGTKGIDSKEPMTLETVS